MTLQRIMLSAGLLALIGMGLFSASVALAQTNRAPRSRNTAQRKLSARQIAQRTGPSVVLLVTADESGNPIALGSGFFVQSNVIATAYHVIKGAPQIYAKIVGKGGRYKISFVGSSDEQNDLALLRINDVKGQPLRLGNISRLRVGDEIYVMGNPEGLEGTFSRGNISAFRVPRPIPDADLFDPVPEYIQITAPISHGSSGGPVLDERGEVIGVATGIFTEGQNLNFAVPVSKLAALLKEDSNPFLIRNPVAPRGDPDLDSGLVTTPAVPNEPAPEWQLVTSGGGNNYYISRTRIRLTPEHTLIAWIKEVPDDSPEGRTARQRKIDFLKTQNVSRRYAFGYSMHQHQFDCGHQKTQLLRSVDYDDQEGELLYDWGDLPAGPNWKPVLPNSVGEAELNFVCKGRQ